jgi:hypothetical protein
MLSDFLSLTFGKIEDSDDLRYSVSFVRASTKKGWWTRNAEINKEVWKSAQLKADRFIIPDSHFRIGQFMRSVPRLCENIAVTTNLFQSTRNAVLDEQTDLCER